MKGAPEKVLQQCTSYYRQGSALPIGTKDWELFPDAVAAMSSKGLRGVVYYVPEQIMSSCKLRANN